MQDRLWIYDYLRNRTARPGFILTGLLVIGVFNAVVFPQFPRWMGVDFDLLPPDLHFFYDRDFMFRFLSGLGERGRRAYLLHEALVDLAYIIIYSLTYTSLFVYIIERFRLSGSCRPYVVTGLAIGFFDLLENACFICLTYRFPDVPETAVFISGVFTAMKWVSAVVALIFLVKLVRHILAK